MADRSLEHALDFISVEARHYVTDAVYCTLFNLAGDLEGNTAESDTDWWAYELWREMHPMGTRWAWEALSVDERAHWEKLASVSIERLPFLLSRIANRCRSQATALGMLAKAERQRLQEKREAMG